MADWTFHTAEPVASSKYKIAGVPFRIDLDLTTNEGKLAAGRSPRRRPTSWSSTVRRRLQQVSYTEHQDLHSPLDRDPLIEMLNRSPALQQALDLGQRASR
jgi:hypothetical protein